MSRRPKLSLVQNREINKKQALGLGPDEMQDTGQASAAPAAAPWPAAEPVQPEQLQAANKPAAPAGGQGWPYGRLLARAAIVVVTAALSIYLLRRKLL